MEAIACLKDLFGTGNPVLEKEARIAMCLLIYAGYKNLNCKGCQKCGSRREAKRNAACLSLEVAGRASYLAEKCDYWLPNSIAPPGSKVHEIGHRRELKTKTKALAYCTAVAIGSTGLG